MTSDDLEERVVTAMAQAMCKADGIDPFAPIITADHAGETQWAVAWHSRRDEALRQYRAWIAMQAILLGATP